MKDETPDISVIIPVFNRADLLPRAIRSCQDSSVAVEVLVVDDGSLEDIRAVLDGDFNNHPNVSVRLFRQENQGACVARNTGLIHAAGEFVKFLDSDDELISGALVQELAAARESQADAVATGWEERWECASPCKTVAAPDLQRGIDDMLLGRGPWTAAALYKRSFVQGLRWDPAWTKAQDWGWALTVCLAGASFCSLNISSAVYHHHAGKRITSQGDALIRSTRARQGLLRMVEDRLREQGVLTEERRRMLVQYYYKDRIIIAEHSVREWRDLWYHGNELSPGFVPSETLTLLRGLSLLAGRRRAVEIYVFLKRVYRLVVPRQFRTL